MTIERSNFTFVQSPILTPFHILQSCKVTMSGVFIEIFDEDGFSRPPILEFDDFADVSLSDVTVEYIYDRTANCPQYLSGNCIPHTPFITCFGLCSLTDFSFVLRSDDLTDLVYYEDDAQRGLINNWGRFSEMRIDGLSFWPHVFNWWAIASRTNLFLNRFQTDVVGQANHFLRMANNAPATLEISNSAFMGTRRVVFHLSPIRNLRFTNVTVSGLETCGFLKIDAGMKMLHSFAESDLVLFRLFSMVTK